MIVENSQNLSNKVEDSTFGEAVSVEMLAQAFHALPDAVYVFDLNRQLIYANNAGRSLQASGTERLMKTRCCDMFWRTEGADFCVVDRALESGERVEVELPLGSDQTRSMLVIVQSLVSGGADCAPGAMVIARDISALRLAEAEAIAQRSFMASIADLTLEEIYALDKDGRIAWMNQRGEADNLSMLPGRQFIDFVAEGSRELALQNLQSTLAGGDFEFELQAICTDGTVRDAEAHTSPLWKEGEVTGVLVFLRDVTQRKRAQELMAQSDKLRAVGELAAGVAHNLNNSLTVIQGRAQLLLMNATEEAAVKSLTVITNAVADGTKTLRRILEFARRDLVKEFGPVELGELVTTSMEIARPKWQTKSTQRLIDIRFECNARVYVTGDLAELREVVLNLIFNAVDAMPNGGTMEVGVRAEIDSGCFWIADTGCGMEAETAARIFEPFFTTKGKSGTGLGLSASHGIISRHGGEIMVVSEPGEGTRFEVRLPVCDATSRFVKKSESSEEESSEQEAQQVTEELAVPG